MEGGTEEEEGGGERERGGPAGTYHRSGGPRRIKSESAEGTNRLITCEADGGTNCRLLSNQHPGLEDWLWIDVGTSGGGRGGVVEKRKPGVRVGRWG